MELEARLRAFAAFVRCGSFSSAARNLRISQPVVSKHIAELERHLAVKLVHRSARGGALTPAGRFIGHHLLRAEALLAQAARGVDDFRDRASGLLTILASGVPATYLLPEVIVAFQRANPDVRVRIVSGASAQTMDALRAYRAEFGVVGGFAAAPEIEAEPLVEEDIVVVGPRKLAGRLLSRREAESATWISPYEGSAARAAVEAAWADSGITPVRHLELPTWEAVKRAVARGYGVAGCSWFTVEQEVRTGSLAVVALRGWKLRRTISIVRHRDTVLTPSAQAFVRMLRARWGTVGRRSFDRSDHGGARRRATLRQL